MIDMPDPDVVHFQHAVLLHPSGPLSRKAAEAWHEKDDYMREALTFAAMQGSRTDADREAGGFLLIALSDMDEAAAWALEGQPVEIDAPEDPRDAMQMARRVRALIGCALREELIPALAIRELCARLQELLGHEDPWRPSVAVPYVAGQDREVRA